MAKATRTATPSTDPNNPADDTITPGDDHDDHDAEHDVAESRARPSPSDDNREADALFQRAKEMLGIHPDASPLDLLKHLVGGKVEVKRSGPPVAACSLVVSIDGRRVVIAEGDQIPEGVDHKTLPHHAVRR